MSGVTGSAVKLLDSSHVPAPVKICSQEHIQRRYRFFSRCHSSTKARHVRVIVLSRGECVRLVANDRPARTRHSINRHTNALPAAAHDHPALYFTGHHSVCDVKTETGIINSFVRLRTNVDHLMALGS